MNDNDPTAFSAALRERVRDEDPDLDQLIQVSTRAGTRLRRRRTVGISIAGVAAGVTMIGIVGAALGGSGGTTGSDPGFATQPTASPTPAAGEVPEAVQTPTPAGPRAQELPVRVDPTLTGWEIGTAADDKFPASKGRLVVSVNVRPISDYDSWSGGDPDRPASQVAHVGDNYFVTVQTIGAEPVPQAVLDELVAALRYKPVWRR